MKICFITEHYNPKFGGQYTAVKCVTDMCKLKKIKYIIVHKKSNYFLDKKKLIKVIKNSDIIHIFGGWTLFYIKISLLAFELKKKTIVHPMGFYEPWSFSQKRIKKFFAWKFYQNNFLRKTNLVHCASKNEEESIKLLDSKINTVILPFGIDKKIIKKTTNYKIKKKCLFFSRIHKKKGLDKLIEAWVELNKKDWKLDVVGFGSQDKYKNIIKKEKNSNIKFLKPVTSEKKKFSLFEKYDFMVLPSSNENFGIVILESLARGLPVLTTNETPWSIIQKQNAGWIINDSIIELKLILNQIFEINNYNFGKKRKNTTKIAMMFNKNKLSNLYFQTYKDLLTN